MEKIGIFGSYIKGTYTEKSDIDILIQLNQENMYLNYCRIKYYLEDLFENDIDLITENQFEEDYITKIAKENREQIKKEILESVPYV